MQSQIPSVAPEENHMVESSNNAANSFEPNQLTLLLIGASYKTSPIDFRERLAEVFDAKQALKQWFGGSNVSEIINLTTCNRIEFYIVTKDPEIVLNYFKERVNRSIGYQESFFYVKTNLSAIYHLFRVAAGLDSMVPGEEQILVQLHDAGIIARSGGNSKSVLSPLFDAAVSTGTRVRKVAGAKIYQKGNSVSSFALSFALEKLGKKPENVLLVGSGKMARLAIKSMTDVNLFVVTKRKISLFEHNKNVKVLSLNNIKDVLGKCELVVTATSGKGFVIKKEDLPKHFKGIIIDLGFPRNVDPSLKEKSEYQLYDLDDLGKISLKQSESENGDAEQFVLNEAKRFNNWLMASKLSPVLSKLYKLMDEIRIRETSVALSRIGPINEHERKAIEAMGRRIMSKFLAIPTTFAKESSPELPQNLRLRLMEDLFNLKGDEDNEKEDQNRN